MKYTVYTDGAYRSEDKVAGCSYLIITPTRYISSNSHKVDGIDSATLAETMAVALSAMYLLNNTELTKDDVVEFNIDCLSTIDFYNNHAFSNGSIMSKVPAIRSAVGVVRRLAKICNVSFEKVKGHKNKIGPNTFVDRLAKIAVRG